MAALSRRTLLGSAIGIGLGAGTSLLTGCSSGPTGSGGTSGPVLPNFVAYNGVKVDHPALPNGTVAGAINFPANPKPAYEGKPGDGKPVTGIAQLNGPLPPSLDGNQFWQELNNRVGSPMQIQLVNAGADFLAKIATIQASGQLPDLMQLNPAVPSLAEFLQAKMLDLGPYLGGDKIKDYPFLAAIPTDHWRGCVYDGRLVGVPIPRGAASTYVMFYRADLLDKLGIEPEVDSYQDFADLLTEVTDPRANRWGLAGLPLDYVRQMCKIPNNFQRQSDGSFVSAHENEHQKDALEATRKLQAKGVFNPDLAAAAPPQRAEWFGSGIGVFNWGTYTGWPDAKYRAKVGLLQVPGFDGGQGLGWSGNLNNNFVSIPAAAKDRAETLLKVVDWLASPFGSAEYLFQRYGIEGVHYTLSGTNPAPIADKSTELSLGHNYLGSCPFVLYRAGSDQVEVEYPHMAKYMDNAVLDPTQLYFSPTYASKGAQLVSGPTSLVKSAELDIIYGRKPVSSWDQVVKDYLAAGGATIKTELAKAAENG